MAAKIKRRLSSSEEFEVMKIVLDKVLWVGTAVLIYGLIIALQGEINSSIYYIIAGAAVLFVFAYFIVKEFERIR